MTSLRICREEVEQLRWRGREMLDPDLCGKSKDKALQKGSRVRKGTEVCVPQRNWQRSELGATAVRAKKPTFAQLCDDGFEEHRCEKLIVSTYGTTNATQVAETEHCNTVLPVECASGELSSITSTMFSLSCVTCTSLAPAALPSTTPAGCVLTETRCFFEHG